MLEWIGSLRIEERHPTRVALRLSRSTRVVGLAVAFIGLALLEPAWERAPELALLPGLFAFAGVVLATLERRLVIDRQTGVLEIEQRLLGIGTRQVVPIFHLRAVVVTARALAGEGRRPGSRFVAYIDRRVGEIIYLDEARRCAGLIKLAEAIADVAELRLEYEAHADAS